MIESLLLTAAHVRTFAEQRPLTNASGFFFQRDERLFLVTSRHVMSDAASQHFPDRIEIELHVDPDNLAESTGFSIPLYREGRGVWRQARDAAGQVDELSEMARALPLDVGVAEQLVGTVHPRRRELHRDRTRACRNRPCRTGQRRPRGSAARGTAR